MKKKLKIILMLLLFLFISGCNNNKEYKIINISAEDLINNMEHGKTMIVVCYADDVINSKTMRNELQNIANDIRSDIYRLDYYHIDMDFGYLLKYQYGFSADDNYYYVLEGTEVKVDEYYTNSVEAVRKLNEYQSSKDIELSQGSKIDKYLEQAEKYYAEGDLFKANEYISKGWSSEKARNYYNEHDEYKILHLWERYKTLNNSSDEFEYTQINTFTGESIYYKKTVKGESKTFEKPHSHDYDNKYYYKVLDKKIYTGTKADKLTPRFEIVFVNNERLVLNDLKTKERIEYIRRD